MSRKAQRESAIKTFKDITDKIAELWEVDKDMAPRIICHTNARPDNDTFIGMHCDSEDYYTALKMVFDELGQLRIKKLMINASEMYFRKVNPSFSKRMGEAAQIYGFYSLRNSSIPQLRATANKRLERYSDKQKENSKVEKVLLESFESMIIHYT